MKYSLVDLCRCSNILLQSVNILLASLARSSASSMREFNEDCLGDVVVELVDTTKVPGVEEIETALVGCLELFGTMAEIVEAEDDTDIGCVNLFTTNSEAVDIIDVVVDSVETTNVSRVEGLVTALVGCVVLLGTTVEFIELDDTDIGCVTSVDAEVEVEDIETTLTSLSLHGVEDNSSEGVEEPQLALDFFLGLDSLCRG